MEKISLKNTATYYLLKSILGQLKEFFDTFGAIIEYFWQTLKFILKFEINIGELITQCSRFAFDSLPISLSIVGMTAIIISIQVAPEMVKQGGGNAIGAYIALIMTREMGTIMAGFAIISMIGAAFASEIATMKVTDQIDAMYALKVHPLKYLFVPRVLAGALMMPVVVIISSAFGSNLPLSNLPIVVAFLPTTLPRFSCVRPLAFLAFFKFSPNSFLLNLGIYFTP